VPKDDHGLEAARVGGGLAVQEDLEEAREQHFWGIVLRALWSSLIFLLVAGALASLTVLLGWRTHLLLCAVGLMAGLAIAVAASGSARGRELTAMTLGAVTLPLLATVLAGVAASDGAAFDAVSASLFPFLAHATGAAAGGCWVARIWRTPLALPRPDGAPEASRAGSEGAAP
jgi:hypothetical protein